MSQDTTINAGADKAAPEMIAPEMIAQAKLHGGVHQLWRHHSQILGCVMEFALFVPAGTGPFTPLYFLSGLTCTWENAATKAGAQKAAAEEEMILVFPDTSPRGEDVADDPSYALGKGAGFYMTATQAPWAAHYKMDQYITEGLPAVVHQIAPVKDGPAGITGHSMGGHGALTLAMKHPDLFGSVSAFSPIVAPSQVPWGRDIFTAYIGADEQEWAAYDACALLDNHGWQGDILIDTGDADPFLAEQLQPHLFAEAARKAGVDLQMRMQPGYDHSYYFVASFISDHIKWHSARLP